MSHLIYDDSEEKFIVYDKHIINQNKASFVIYVHGYRSDMYGQRASFLKNYCQERNYNYIRFSNFGSRGSYGKFEDQTITSWLMGLELVFDRLITSNQIVLVGSSKGGWLSLLLAMKRPERIKSVVAIAPAIDFTEELIWSYLTDDQKKSMIEDGLIYISSRDNETDCYPITHKLVVDGRRHLLFNKNKVNIECPIHIIHGMHDDVVPYDSTIRLAKILTTDQLVMKLIKDANHKLSRQQDMRIICNSIDELCL